MSTYRVRGMTLLEAIEKAKSPCEKFQCSKTHRCAIRFECCAAFHFFVITGEARDPRFIKNHGERQFIRAAEPITSRARYERAFRTDPHVDHGSKDAARFNWCEPETSETTS